MKSKRQELSKHLEDFIEKNEKGTMLGRALKLPGATAIVRHPNLKIDLELWVVVTDLNDHHGWSRDQIADWLDRLNDEGLDLSFEGKGDAI